MFKWRQHSWRAALAIVLASLLCPGLSSAQASTVAYFGALAANLTYPTNSMCAAEIAPTAEVVVNLPVSGCAGSSSFATTSNGPFNAGVPSASQLSSYKANGYTFDPYPEAQFARVDGQYPAVLGSTPSTDMILRYAACKFGLDEDVIRADATEESGWEQGVAGDLGYGSGSCVQGGFTSLYDRAIIEPDGTVMPGIQDGCCQSWSILQTKVYYEWMTWPMIMEDTSFAAEHLGAEIRTCMNGGYRSYMNAAYWKDYQKYSKNPSGYNSGVPNYYNGNNQSLNKTNTNRMLWGCIGTHYAGYDWYDSVTNPYIRGVEQHLHRRDWP